MDEQPVFTNPVPNIPVTHQAEQYLHSVRKWSRFFAILGFIYIAFLLIFSAFIGSFITAMQPEGMRDTTVPALATSGMVFTAIILFFPILYLFKFSNGLDRAMVNRSGTDMERAFRHLRNHYMFVGVITIVVILLYIIGMIAIAALNVTQSI